MPIVRISEALLQRSTVSDGRLLRDRVLCGFCVRMNARRRTFRVATSVAGKPFRMTLGYWPLMSVDEARAMAMAVKRGCRSGGRPSKTVAVALAVANASGSVRYVLVCNEFGDVVEFATVGANVDRLVTGQITEINQALLGDRSLTWQNTPDKGDIG